MLLPCYRRLTLKQTMDRLRENLNIVDVLDHIFAEGAKSKRKRAYEKQIQMSGFPIKKTLDDFDFSFQPSTDKRQIDELATMRFLENGENVVFLGPPGVGKTHLASTLGLVAAQHRFSTYYVNCHQLIEQLKKAHFENRLPDRLRGLGKYKMLIIDAIGYPSWTFRAQICSFNSLPDGTRKRPLFLHPTKPSSSGTRFLPTLPLPPLSWTAFCTIVP